MFFILKVLVSALIIAIASEIARYNRLLAAIVTSLPLVSLLTFIWIYLNTKNTEKIVELSYDIFWLVLFSLVFFLLFPAFIKYGFHFWISLSLACCVLVIIYLLTLYIGPWFFNYEGGLPMSPEYSVT